MTDFGVSPITKRIYMGKSKKIKNGVSTWTGKKTDVTDQVIAVVFDWFIENIGEGKNECKITYDNMPYELVMTRLSTTEQKETQP